MNSIPAASAICARRRQSAQLPDQRSGTRVTARPEEQLAPNRPSLSLFALYIAARSAAPIMRSIAASPGTPRNWAKPCRNSRELQSFAATAGQQGGDHMPINGANHSPYLYLGLAGETGGVVRTVD